MGSTPDPKPAPLPFGLDFYSAAALVPFTEAANAHVSNIVVAQ